MRCAQRHDLMQPAQSQALAIRPCRRLSQRRRSLTHAGAGTSTNSIEVASLLHVGETALGAISAPHALTELSRIDSRSSASRAASAFQGSGRRRPGTDSARELDQTRGARRSRCGPARPHASRNIIRGHPAIAAIAES